MPPEIVPPTEDPVKAALVEATDHKTTESRPVAPVTVAIVGTGDGSRLASGTVATTAGSHEPNIVIQAVQPVVAVGVRFANTFLIQLVGLLVAAMTPTGATVLHARDFFHLVALCAGLALPGAGLGFLKDLVTIFGRLEQKFPLATGSI